MHISILIRSVYIYIYVHSTYIYMYSICIHTHIRLHRCTCIYGYINKCRTVRHPVSPVLEWNKLTMPEQVRYRAKPTQSGIFWVRYRNKIMGTGMPMPALVSSKPMPSCARHRFQFHLYISLTIILSLLPGPSKTLGAVQLEKLGLWEKSWAANLPPPPPTPQ
jgi:hypothetical protein